MKSTTTHWRIPLVGWVVIVISVTAEAASNALRAFGLGANLEKFTVTYSGHGISLSGAVLVLAAVAVSIAQARAVWVAFTSGPVRQRVIASLAGVLLIAVSATALSQHVLKGMRYETSNETAARERHARALDAYTAAKGELDRLGNPRSVAEVQADVQATRIDMRIWRRSNECSDISRDDTKRECAPILDLYKERGAAARKAELEPEVAKLKAELDANPAPIKAGEGEDKAATIWAWLFSIAVVTIATFGSVIFARVETVEIESQPTATHRDAPETVETDDETGRNDPPPYRGPRPATKKDARLDTVTLTSLGFVAPSQEYYRERWGMAHKGTVSRWLSDFEDAGLITRTKDARCKAVA